MPLMPRPTRGALAVLAGAITLGVAGRIAGAAWVSAASGGLAGWLVAAFLLARAPRGAVVTLDPGGPAQRGRPATLTVTSTAGRRGLGPHTVTVAHPAFGPVTVAMPGLGPQGQAEATVTATPPRRGIWSDAGSWEVAVTSPLGLAGTRVGGGLTGRVVVRPAPATPLPLPAAPGSTGTDRGPRDPGPGVEVHGLREWRSGDPASAVHARASARRGRPVVLEREPDGTAPLVIVAGRPGPDWEKRIERAAATAVQALREGRELVLLGLGPTLRRPREREVLDWFAALPQFGDRAPATATPDPDAVVLRIGT
jgi:uncharacterized protein (DUF58 family)